METVAISVMRTLTHEITCHLYFTLTHVISLMYYIECNHVIIFFTKAVADAYSIGLENKLEAILQIHILKHKAMV